MRLIDVDELIPNVKIVADCDFNDTRKKSFKMVLDMLTNAPTVTTDDYNKGLEDVWKLLKAFYDMEVGERQEVFGEYAVEKLVENMSPQKALAKLEAYEKEQNQIKVGDVVKNGNGETEFVVIATSEETINGQPILRPIGKTLIKGVIFTSDTDLKKTGKHIDITSVLEQLKGE